MRRKSRKRKKKKTEHKVAKNYKVNGKCKMGSFKE